MNDDELIALSMQMLEDDEEFCPTCFAGLQSSQHLTDPRCGGC